MITLSIICNGNFRELQVQPGDNLLTILQRADIPVHAPCGGQGHCKKCRVKLTEGDVTRTVLACMTEITRDCTVDVPEMSGGVISVSGGRDQTSNISSRAPANHTEPAASSAPPDSNDTAASSVSADSVDSAASSVSIDTAASSVSTDSADHIDFSAAKRSGYGLAVDLGTTTVVAALYSLSGITDGYTPLGIKAEWNAQTAYGADVISRAQYCMDHPDGLQTLSGVIRRQIFSIAGQLCMDADIAFTDISETVVAGNTIMQHLFVGLDPSSIAVAPFTPSTLFEDGRSYHFPECPNAAVTFLPCVAGYVGGDITAGLLSGRLMDESGLALFLDIGTNGEMALWDGTQFYCCSVASGPAFEGAEITCGMSSTPGAINHVSYQDGHFQLQIIGESTDDEAADGKAAFFSNFEKHSRDAKGLCGSGLIDLLAVLLDLEIVDESGWLLPPDEAEDDFVSYLSEDENGNGIFHLTPKVVFTAADVRKLQLAKAAVAAGIEILLKTSGHTVDEVETLFLAGGFGDNLNPENAAKIGMIPAELTDRIFCLGNSSLDGARQLLLSPSRLKDLNNIQQHCRYIELSGSADFSEAFIEHMGFED